MSDDRPVLKMVLPKGRIQEKVLALLGRIGVHFSFNSRSYRPRCSDPSIEAKILKPQNIASLVDLNRHDCGFTGHDWVREQQADVVELLDLGYDPVRIIAAMPDELARQPLDPSKRIVVASEYQQIAKEYLEAKGLNAVLIKAFGATEALPPEDADMIIDNTSTGTTLHFNRLTIVDDIMQSTTRFIASKEAMADPVKRQRLEEITLLLKSALIADERVLLEMNVSSEHFEALVSQLPAMRSPTVSPLHNHDGYAVKVSVPSKEVSRLIPRLLALGACDILEYRLEKIVPGP